MAIGLIGGALGGLASAGGSYLAAQEASKAAAEQRAFLERIRTENVQLMDATSREEREMALRQLNRARTEETQTELGARSQAQRQALSVFGSPMYQQLSGFVGNVMSGNLPEAIAQQVQGSYRSAQEARGIRGAAASRDESRAWGSFLFQQAQQMIPVARQLAMDPFELVNRAQMQDVQFNMANRQYATAGLQQYLSSSQSAQQIASAQVNPILGSNMNLASQANFSAANPTANLLQGLGQTVAGISGQYAGMQGLADLTAALQARKDPSAGKIVDPLLDPGGELG